MLELGQQ